MAQDLLFQILCHDVQSILRKHMLVPQNRVEKKGSRVPKTF
jgi:hypothetical protein